MTDFDCSKLHGRPRDICEGRTHHSPEERDAYIKIFSGQSPSPIIPKPMRSRGLGDTIAKITHATGLAWFAERAAKAIGLESCGCAERQQWLNELVPYRPDGMADDEWRAVLHESVGLFSDGGRGVDTQTHSDTSTEVSTNPSPAGSAGTQPASVHPG